MKSITKWIVGTLVAVALLIPSYGNAQNTTVATTPTQTQSTSLFNAGELGLSLGTAYDVGAASQVNGKTLFNNPYTFNISGGVFYFPWRNLGFEANVPFYQTKGVSVDEVQAGILFRVPLAEETPFFKSLAPYIGLDGVYNWQTVQDWAYIAKAGLEFRFNRKWGLFAEGNYRNYELSNWSQGEVSVRGGLRFVF